jgi:hypothetical protein
MCQAWVQSPAQPKQNKTKQNKNYLLFKRQHFNMECLEKLNV